MKQNLRRSPIRPRALAFLILSLAWSPALWAKNDVVTDPTNYEMVMAPTAYTLGHGGYDLVTEMYDNGGVYVRANVGFEKFFMFGFSANGTNLVGNGTIQVQAPRLFFKLKPLDEGTSPVALAIAWDDRGYGVVNGGRFFPGTEEGFYVAASHEFKELGWLQLHGGVNLVKFDNFDASQDLGCFFGTSFAVTPVLAFNMEVNQLLTTYWQYNANVMFNLDNPLRIGLDLRDINRPDLFARVLRVQYISFF